MSIDQGTFSTNTDFILNILSYDETKQYSADEGRLVGTVVEISATSDEMEKAYLSKPVAVSMPIPSREEFDKANMDRYVAACLIDDEWISVHPLAVDLAKGIITFETDHFTRFAVISLEEQALIKKIAADYAKRAWSKGNSREQVMVQLKATIQDALNNAGIKDQVQQDSIILSIKKSSKYDSLVSDIEHGKDIDLNKTCSEMTSDAIMSRYVDFPGSSMIPVAGVASSLAKGTAELERGNYKNATIEYAKALAKAFPPANLINSAVEGVQFSGILARDWDRFSENIAYRIYDEYIGGKGDTYGIDSPEWTRVMIELYGSVAEAKRAALVEHSLRTGKSVAELADDRAFSQSIFEDHNKMLKNRFAERYILERDLAMNQAESVKIVQGMMDAGLLTRGALAFNFDVDIRERIDLLFLQRDYILELFGGEMPVLAIGESSEANLNEALASLLICRGDTAEFFKWLEDKGYLVRQNAQPSETTNPKDSTESFSAVHESSTNQYFTDRFETGLDRMMKKNGSLAFAVDKNGKLSIQIPSTQVEKAANDNDAFLHQYTFDPISIVSSGKMDADNIWQIQPGSITVRLVLIPTHMDNPEENTITIDYECQYEGFVRVYDWDTNNVQINLGMNYRSIVDGTEDPEKQINRIDFWFTRMQ